MLQNIEPIKKKDNLIEINVGENEAQENLYIDDTSCFFNFLYIAFFISILLLSIFISNNGPSSVLSFSRTHPTSLHGIEQGGSGFSKKNQFLNIYLSFPQLSQEINGSINYALNVRQNNHIISTYKENIHTKITSDLKMQIFNQPIEFNNFILKVECQNDLPQLKWIQVNWNFANLSYVKFQTLTRLVLTIFLILAIIIMQLFYHNYTTRSFLLSQKVTLMYLIFTAIGLNPFYFTFISGTSIFKRFINALFSSIGIAFLGFHSICLIDNQRLINTQERPFFFTPKIIWFFISTIMLTAANLSKFSPTINNALEIFSLSITLLYSILITVFGFHQESTDFHEVKIFITYLSFFALTYLTDFVYFDFRSSSNIFFSKVEYALLMQNVAHTFYGLFMMIFHFPHPNSNIMDYQDQIDNPTNDRLLDEEETL